jgi:hypothetical protein
VSHEINICEYCLSSPTDNGAGQSNDSPAARQTQVAQREIGELGVNIAGNPMTAFFNVMPYERNDRSVVSL